jgi:hypothetical protein
MLFYHICLSIANGIVETIRYNGKSGYDNLVIVKHIVNLRQRMHILEVRYLDKQNSLLCAMRQTL